MGVTGSGKSSTLNSLCGEERFETSGNTESETYELKGVALSLEKDITDQTILVDSPGIGDSQGRDKAHIEMIIEGLRALGCVHTFLIVINY